MKEKILLNSVISFILLNIWTLYLFFNYYIEKEMLFPILGLFFNFGFSMMVAVGFGCILLIIRFILFLKKKDNSLKTNFFYILCGIFNFNFFIIWLICMTLKIIEIGNGMLAGFAIGSLLISTFIIFDIYKSSFLDQIN